MTAPETPSPSPLSPLTDDEREGLELLAKESLKLGPATTAMVELAQIALRQSSRADSLAARVSDLEAAARLVVSTRETGCVFHEEHSGGKPCGSCLFSDAVAALAEVLK